MPRSDVSKHQRVSLYFTRGRFKTPPSNPPKYRLSRSPGPSRTAIDPRSFHVRRSNFGSLDGGLRKDPFGSTGGGLAYGDRCSFVRTFDSPVNVGDDDVLGGAQLQAHPPILGWKATIPRGDVSEQRLLSPANTRRRTSERLSGEPTRGPTRTAIDPRSFHVRRSSVGLTSAPSAAVYGRIPSARSLSHYRELPL